MKTISHTDKEFICDITLPCFSALTREETDLVRDSRVQVVFRRGENITKQGAFASYVIFIVSGFSRQYIECSNGRDYNLRIITSRGDGQASQRSSTVTLSTTLLWPSPRLRVSL